MGNREILALGGILDISDHEGEVNGGKHDRVSSGLKQLLLILLAFCKLIAVFAEPATSQKFNFV